MRKPYASIQRQGKNLTLLNSSGSGYYFQTIYSGLQLLSEAMPKCLEHCQSLLLKKSKTHTIHTIHTTHNISKRTVGETIGALNSSGLGEKFELLSKAMPECF